MRCDDVKDLLPLHPLDLLDEAEAAAVRAHLETGCPRCASEAAAVRETLALLPLALPPEEPSPMAKARLMAAVRKAPAPRPVPVEKRPERGAGARRGAWLPAAAAAAAAAVLSAVVTAGVVGGRRDVEIATLKDEIAFLRGEVRGAQEAIQLVSSPGVVVIDLAGQGPAASGAARIFWDRGRSVWQLYAANLPRPAAGRTYQLWVITADQRKIGAGTFGAGAAGEASLRAGLAVDAGAVAAAAVTEEPEGGSPQPTGPIVLLGKV